MAEQEQFTKYETARMLGSRALQIAMGAPILIKLSDKEMKGLKFNPVEIAKLEMEKDLLPLTVRRPLPEAVDEGEEEKAAA